MLNIRKFQKHLICLFGFHLYKYVVTSAASHVFIVWTVKITCQVHAPSYSLVHSGTSVFFQIEYNSIDVELSYLQSLP